MTGRWADSTRRQQLPPGWSSRIVPRIRKRDGNRCTRCRSTERLEVHHIGDPHDHSDDNLATLCHACHAGETAREATAARRPRASTKRPAEPHPGLRGGG